MRATLRSLELLHETTRTPDPGVPTSETRAQQEKLEQEKQRRIAALSPYKQSEYQTLECIKQLRESLRESEAIDEFLKDCPASSSSSASVRVMESATSQYTHPFATRDKNTLTQDLARARLAARRAHQQLQKCQRDAQRLYVSEQQDSQHNTKAGTERGGAEGGAGPEPLAVSHRELMAHVERAKTWYRESFGIHVMSSLDDPLVMGGAPALVKAMSGLGPSTSSRGGPSGRPAGHSREEQDAATQGDQTVQSLRHARNWREDAEFEQFFLLVEQNDALIDTSLDRIHAGVLRLRDNAVAINTELDVQANLLNQTEQKIERNSEGVRDLNRRLARAIRDLNNSDICAYVVCLLMLVAVLCVLLRIVG